MKREIRLFINKNGILTVEDPSPLEIKLLSRLGIKLKENSNSTYKLPSRLSLISKKSKSFWASKRKLFERYLKRCFLCGYKCKGKRILLGECPMGKPSYYYQHFIHVGEEKEIGRTLVIELVGCNIRCKFCQKGELISPKRAHLNPFTPSLWKEIKKEYKNEKIDSISFLGGNPDQSFLSILEFLEATPKWALNLPIVWHTNGYSTPALYNLLYGLVDIFVFDFKYFNNNCAINLSKAPKYKETAKLSLKYICEERLFPLVIVRHLVLPGHWECCQKPLIDWLKKYKNNILFNPMSQYKPMWMITERDGILSFPIKEEEYLRVRDYALNAGLTLTE